MRQVLAHTLGSAKTISPFPPATEFRVSHQGSTDHATNLDGLQQGIDMLIPKGLLAGVNTRKGARWQAYWLGLVGFLWGSLPDGSLEERFEQARDLAEELPSRRTRLGTSFEGFKKCLLARGEEIINHLIAHFRRLTLEQEGLELVPGYRVFGADGSRIQLPRTQANENHYASSRPARPAKPESRKRKKKRKQTSTSTKKKCDAPLMWLTLLWEVSRSLPWAWRTGPMESSEREHTTSMLDELPENALLTCDAGFVGYDFWNSIVARDLGFLIRVGGNVKLLRNLGFSRQNDSTVYLWPDENRRRNQPPLVLRLITLMHGKEKVYLVTNLSEDQMTDDQALRVYRSRWGIEVYFRSLKQTFCRDKLRSHCPKYVEMELDWAMLGLWGMLLTGQRAQAALKTHTCPQSPAMTIRVFRRAIRNPGGRWTVGRKSFWVALADASVDQRQPKASKTSRNYPRKKKRKPISPPTIQLATAEQKRAAKRLMAKQDRVRLAA